MDQKTTLRSRYGMSRPSVVSLSSVTLLHPTYEGWNFRQYFCTSLGPQFVLKFGKNSKGF